MSDTNRCEPMLYVTKRARIEAHAFRSLHRDLKLDHATVNARMTTPAQLRRLADWINGVADVWETQAGIMKRD